MQVLLTRDSVAAGDDVESHDREVDVDERQPTGLVVESVVRSGYLPLIGGGRATWLVRSGRRGAALAVVAQQWERAALLVADDTEIGETGPSLHFEYLTQEDPDTVVEQWRGGRR